MLQILYDVTSVIEMAIIAWPGQSGCYCFSRSWTAPNLWGCVANPPQNTKIINRILGRPQSGGDQESAGVRRLMPSLYISSYLDWWGSGYHTGHSTARTKLTAKRMAPPQSVLKIMVPVGWGKTTMPITPRHRPSHKTIACCSRPCCRKT